MLLGVKISDQYVNILSILRGKVVNIQYQYLEEQESIFIQILSSDGRLLVFSSLIIILYLTIVSICTQG